MPQDVHTLLDARDALSATHRFDDPLVAEVSAARAPFGPWATPLRAQWRSDATPRMPHGKHPHLVTEGT